MQNQDSCNKYEAIEKKNNAFAQCGLLVHELLEANFSGKIMLTEMEELFEKHFYDYVTEPFPYFGKTDLEESYFSTSKRFLSEYEGFDYEVVGSEIQFQTSITETDSLTGFIDLLLRNSDDDYIIVDFKSKAGFKSKKELKEYSRQLYLYSTYVKEQYGKYPKELGFYMFRNEEPGLFFAFDKSAYKEAVQWMYSQLEKIKSFTEYPAVYSGYCETLCNYRDSCQKKWQMKEERANGN